MRKYNNWVDAGIFICYNCLIVKTAYSIGSIVSQLLCFTMYTIIYSSVNGAVDSVLCSIVKVIYSISHTL